MGGKSKGQREREREPQPSTSRGSTSSSKEQVSNKGASKNDISTDLASDTRDEDQVRLIGPHTSSKPPPTICSTMMEKSKKGGKGERLKSSLKWHGSLQERDIKSPEGWRMSHSSVSSIYYSAQDISELMSVETLSDWSSDQLSSFRSYHSVRDSLLFDKDSDDSDKDDEDIFNSPQESPTCSGAPIHHTNSKKVTVMLFVLNISIYTHYLSNSISTKQTKLVCKNPNI